MIRADELTLVLETMSVALARVARRSRFDENVVFPGVSSVPIELLIMLLATAFSAALVVMAALSGLADRRLAGTRLPDLSASRNLLLALIDTALARPRPIYLKVRSSRAPPTFPKQSDADRRFSLAG